MKKEFKFVRYGKLKPVKQKGFGSDSYHSPPKGKGFYAFPFGFEEIFLVAGLPYQNKVNRSLPKITKTESYRYYNRTSEEYVIRNDDWETVDIWKQKKEFVVNGDKFIWHHLEDYIKDKGKVVARSGSWCQTTVHEWKKAFSKCMNKQKMEHWKEFGKGSINEIKYGGYYSKDHLEVFFDFKV